jgi:hypothetical protein
MKILPLLLLLLVQQIYGYSCNVIDHGFDQKIVVEYNINSTISFTITVGEIPTVSAGVGFFYLNQERESFIQCLSEDGVFASHLCPRRLSMYDILGQKNTTLYETIGRGSIMWNISYPYMKYTPFDSNMTDDYYLQSTINGGRVYQFQRKVENIVGERLFIFITLRNRLSVDLTTTYPTSDYWTVAKEIVIGDSINGNCAFYKYLYSKSRWDLYNYSRIGRFATIIVFTIFALFLNIMYRRYNVVRERIFSTVISLIMYFLYGVLGMIFAIFDIQFQAFEYAIYITISNIYFISFIRFAINRLMHIQGMKYYAKISSSGVLSKSSTPVLYYEAKDISIDRYMKISTLSSAIPREMTYGWILWLNILCNIYTIVIAIYDLYYKTPYSTFGPSVSVLKFVAPVVGSLLPAVIALLMDIRSLPIRDIRKGIAKYMSICEDPLLYRYEFIVALCAPLPLAIITFCMGYLDTNTIIPDYIIGRRAILYTFHGICYMLFDVSFLFLTSGIYVIHRGSQLFTNTEDIDYTPDIHSRKWTEIDIALYLLSQDVDGKNDMFQYCVKANLIDIWTLYQWFGTMLRYKDRVEIVNSLSIFLDKFYSSKNTTYADSLFSQYRDICVEYHLLNEHGLFSPYDTITIEKKELRHIVRILYEMTEDTLFGALAISDFIRTGTFSDYFDENKSRIADYIVGILDNMDDTASTISSDDDILQTKVASTKRGDILIYNRDMVNTVSERMSLLLIPSEDISTISDDEDIDDIDCDIKPYNMHSRELSFTGIYEMNIGLITPSDDLSDQYIKHRSMGFKIDIELID